MTTMSCEHRLFDSLPPCGREAAGDLSEFSRSLIQSCPSPWRERIATAVSRRSFCAYHCDSVVAQLVARVPGHTVAQASSAAWGVAAAHAAERGDVAAAVAAAERAGC